MMLIISENDKQMIKETDKWMYLGDDGKYHLKKDAPTKIKNNYDKIKKLLKEM